MRKRSKALSSRVIFLLSIFVLGCGNISRDALEADRLADQILIEFDDRDILKESVSQYEIKRWLSDEIYLHCRSLERP